MSMAAIILACLMPLSCGQNSRQSVGDESGYKGGLVPVPVYFKSELSSGVYIALMNSDTGELVQFDNDEDYSGYCAFFRFVDDCNIRGCDYKEVFGSDYDELVQDYIVSDTVYNFHCSLINAVIDYMNGDKDKIKDRTLFKRIDKAFYDNHPDQDYYYLKSSGYGWKRYHSAGREVYVEGTEYNRTWSWSYFFYDGTELPEGTLVVSID